MEFGLFVDVAEFDVLLHAGDDQPKGDEFGFRPEEAEVRRFKSKA